MLDLTAVQKILNKGGKKPCDTVLKWRGVFYRMSLHIDGACPYFFSLRYDTVTRQYIRASQKTFPNNYLGEEYQVLFDEYSFSAHPRERVEQREWRYSQYKPFTQAPFLKCIQMIGGGIFQDSGYSINIANQKDYAYIDGNNFEGSNLLGYVHKKLRSICTDPNGIFIVLPRKAYYETDTTDIQPDIVWVSTRHIWHADDEDIIFQKDNTIWHINTDSAYRYQKNGSEWVNVDGDNLGYYKHGFGYVPYIHAGGIWNEYGFYESYLLGARSYADEFIVSKSAEQLVNKEASHPYIIETETLCNSCGATGKVKSDCDCGNECNFCNGQPVLKECGTCHGLGVISRNPGDRIIAPAKDMTNDLIKIISPDVAINKFHLEHSKGLYDGMTAALHMAYIEQAQSGVAKTMDMEGKYQFILGISNDLFDRLIPFLVKCILSYRNVRVVNDNITPDATDFTIVKPSQFQIKTSYDLSEEYKLAKDSGMPTFLLNSIMQDYVDKQFGGNDLLKRKAYYIGALDIVSVRTIDEISAALLQGSITQRQAQFHMVLPGILDEIIRANTAEQFLQMPYETVKSKVEAAFELQYPALPEIQTEDVTVREDV